MTESEHIRILVNSGLTDIINKYEIKKDGISNHVLLHKEITELLTKLGVLTKEESI